MTTLIKVVALILVLFLIVYPMLPIKTKGKKFSSIAALKFDSPHMRKNAIFIFVAIFELVLFILLYGVIEDLGDIVLGIPVIGDVFSDVTNALGSNVRFVTFAVAVIIGNLVMIYAYVVLKSVVKGVLNKFFGGKEKKNAKPEKEEIVEDDVAEEEEEKKSLHSDNIPVLDHVRKKRKKKVADEEDLDGESEEKKRYGFFAYCFFEGENYEYAKPSVARLITILQWFVYLVEVIYVALILSILVSALFPVSSGVYTFLLDTLKIEQWYLYPFLSVIILQEICNTFKTKAKPDDGIACREEKLSEEEKRKENKIALRSLSSDLKKSFDADHKLRYYPSRQTNDDKFEYEFTDSPYKSAMEYIQKTVANRNGNRGQSYLECLDAIFNEEHVYFCASFYSEIGEYLIAYTYTRLLAGERLVFVVLDKNKRDALRRYILRRLTKMTGCTSEVTWRVYTKEDRLDQADILIASPDDFKDDNIVENYPDFFEEVCNAILIDADKVVSLESYLCPVLAIRLLKATSNRIKFVFLSQDLIRGFAASSLPKLFCVDKVLSFSSATDNEEVEYTLWNKESANNRIYYKSGQKLMSLEGIIAEKAYKYGIDGIRVVTSSPIDHGERKILEEHNVEINEFYKDVPNINYMIYSDDRCNLASAIYTCTRFRGQRNSVVQIISKPYLLREYFMFKATKENFIKRSSFIQPRITEHAEKERLSLLKIFCKAATADGMSVTEFVTEMKSTITISRIRGDIPLCSYCRNEKFDNLESVALKDYAAYLIAALCDDANTKFQDSYGNKSKDYYILVDHVNHELYSLTKEKFIVFKKVREVLEKVFSCSERVTLRLNDSNIGILETFPTRVPLEYVVGQPIIYNNAEYEIEQISDDNRIIFLRRENVTFKNCLDTVFLRRYKINSLEKIGTDGVLYNSESVLKEIKVTMMKADIEGETYGFYNLMSNNQSLDFVHGVEGNPHLEEISVEKNKRYLRDGRLLKVTLTSDLECNDGMRLLCSAVFNEFIKTIFPKAYRCIAICPILEEPFAFDEETEAETFADKIKTLYPYIKQASEEFTETDKNRMRFLFINDCEEDVGVLDWFYDKLASYMQEFLINAYSYLYWLNARPDLNHYIYFGADKLCECFDLEGCIKLFTGYNIIISDDGKENYQTAGEYEEEEKLRCSFCHNYMESGRYSFFDDTKTSYICADCMDIIGDETQLKETSEKIKKYLAVNYPEVGFGYAEVVFAPEKEKISDLNEWYFRFNPDKRQIIVGYELPSKNLEVAILCGIISMWQYDNDLMTEYSNAQLNYEQLKYLRKQNAESTAQWIYDNLDQTRRENVDEITDGIKSMVKDDDENSYTSFSFMIESGEKMRLMEEEVDYEDIEDEEYSDFLYDPNKTPRFWKRYFLLEGKENRGEVAVTDDDVEDVEDDDGGEEGDDMLANQMRIFVDDCRPNCPPPSDDDDGDLDSSDLFNPLNDDPYDDPLLDDDSDETDEVDELDDSDETDEADDSSDSDNADETDDSDDLFDGLDDGADLDDDIDGDDLDDDDDDLDGEKRTEKKGNKKSDKGEKERKKKEDQLKKGQKRKTGFKKVPYELEEEKNPKLRIYNEIVRHAYNYDEGMFSREGVTDSELKSLFECAKQDYPELFWVNTYRYTEKEIGLSFRCKTASGVLDVKQIERKLKELRNGAKFFLKGITKKTDPYKALMTIYKRLILTLDYDGKGLNERIDADLTKDDRLRSLHSAIVRHKTVCAGYAVAMQYLLQAVGIPCAYVVSESYSNECHAFNIVKLGKYCYYLDVTWGDQSNTTNGDRNKDIIDYGYCCVPYSDFIITSESQKYCHIPRKEMYPWFNKELRANRHEYYRYNKAYVSRYNEDDLVRIFAGTAIRYNPKEDGRFIVSFRCTGAELAKQMGIAVSNPTVYSRIVAKAKKTIGKNKRAQALLSLPVEKTIIESGNIVCVVYKKKAK